MFSNMKTSNKILLGLLITALLIFVSVHAAIYIKYKNTDYSGVNANESFKRDYQFKDIKYILAENISADLNYSDTVRLQISERKDTNFRKINYVQRGDSLIVFAAANDHKKLSGHVKLSVNKDVVVNAKESFLFIRNITDSLMAPSYVLNLEGSSINLGLDSPDRLTYLNSLKISSRKDSEITLNNAVVSQAEISLQETKLNLYETKINRFKLRNDKSSTVFFTGSNVSWSQN
jgi:hypothetical protein